MKIHLKPINQQVIVLFGSTSGIGLETALRMSEKGARVAIIGRNQEGLDIAVDRVREQMRVNQIAQTRKQNASIPVSIEDRVIGILADASDWDSVKSAADQVMTAFGRIDTWVHLAGVSEWALFEDTSPDEFRRIIDVNLVGQAYGAMAALPYLRQQGSGALIFVSSVAGRVPLPYQSAYVASKHGILGMADSLRLEMQHNQVPISVTAILPGSMNTPLFSKARTKLGVEPAPIPPVYDPRIAANAIIYAATHPVREMIVGGSGFMMQAIRRYSSPASSSFMKATGFTAQRSDEVKSAQDADNLYHHIAGYNQVEGEYGPAKAFSMYTWLQTHPVVRYVLIGSIVGGLAFLGARLIMGRRKKSIWQRMGKAVTKQAKAVKMPRVVAKRNLPQKVAHQARKQVRNVSHKLPFVQHAAWYEAIPLISMLPFLQKKSRIEKARDAIGDTVSSIGKSAQGIGKSAQGLGKTASKTAAKTFNRTTDRASKRIDRITNRVGKTADKVVKKQSDLMDQVKDTAKDQMKAVKSIDLPSIDMPEIKSQRASRLRMPFMRREKMVEETERDLPNGKMVKKVVETVSVVDTDRKMIDKVEKKVPASRRRRERMIEKL